MYSLFDTLTTLCYPDMYPGNNDDNILYKKDVLMRNNIKEITKIFKFDVERVTNWCERNCLMLACMGNASLCLIKYLIEEHKMNVDCVDWHNDNCLTLACWGNTNLEVIKYLIVEHRMKIQDITIFPFNKFSNIVSLISKNVSCNNLLWMGYQKYESNEMKRVVSLINPLQLSDVIRNLAGIGNPYDGKFKIFMQYVDDLMYCCDPAFIDKD